MGKKGCFIQYHKNQTFASHLDKSPYEPIQPRGFVRPARHRLRRQALVGGLKPKNLPLPFSYTFPSKPELLFPDSCFGILAEVGWRWPLTNSYFGYNIIL